MRGRVVAVADGVVLVPPAHGERAHVVEDHPVPDLQVRHDLAATKLDKKISSREFKLNIKSTELWLLK